MKGAYGRFFCSELTKACHVVLFIQLDFRVMEVMAYGTGTQTMNLAIRLPCSKKTFLKTIQFLKKIEEKNCSELKP